MSEIKDVVDILDRLNIEIVRITDNEIQSRCPFKENHRHDDKKGSNYVERKYFGIHNSGFAEIAKSQKMVHGMALFKYLKNV